MTRNDALFHYLLRLGDDAVVLGHRMAELCSRAPLLEEDLALTNIALDFTGRAELLFEYAAQIEGRGQSGDDLVYRRPERHFYNHLLTEQPNGDFGQTIVRLMLFSAFDTLLMDALTHSTDAQLAAIASKGLKEARYHLAHASDWVIRLGQGTEESRTRTQRALDALWSYTGDLFETDDVDRLLLEGENTATELQALRPAWLNNVEKIIADAGLQRPADGYMHTGSRRGIHTEHLGHLLSEMQYLVRAYPDAQW